MEKNYPGSQPFAGFRNANSTAVNSGLGEIGPVLPITPPMRSVSMSRPATPFSFTLPHRRRRPGSLLHQRLLSGYLTVPLGAHSQFEVGAGAVIPCRVRHSRSTCRPGSGLEPVAGGIDKTTARDHDPAGAAPFDRFHRAGTGNNLSPRDLDRAPRTLDESDPVVNISDNPVRDQLRMSLRGFKRRVRAVCARSYPPVRRSKRRFPCFPLRDAT